MASVFITGATGLLGKMFVRAFLERGYQVIYISSSDKNIKKMNGQYGDYVNAGMLRGYCVDLAGEKCIEKIGKYLKEDNIKINYLINNARSLENVLVEDWKNIDINKWQGEYLLDVIVPYQLAVELSKKEYGLKGIVNIASMYGFLPYNDFLCKGSNAIAINYGTAKAALLQLTRELAIRFSDNRIQVNAISYGGVDGRADDEFKQRYAKLCPWHDMLSKNDVVGHILYLCSEESRGMTGQNLVVDGGFSLW